MGFGQLTIFWTAPITGAGAWASLGPGKSCWAKTGRTEAKPDNVNTTVKMSLLLFKAPKFKTLSFQKDHSFLYGSSVKKLSNYLACGLLPAIGKKSCRLREPALTQQTFIWNPKRLLNAGIGADYTFGFEKVSPVFNACNCCSKAFTIKSWRTLEM